MSVNEGLLISHADSKALSSFSLVSPPHSLSPFACVSVARFPPKCRENSQKNVRILTKENVIYAYCYVNIEGWDKQYVALTLQSGAIIPLQKRAHQDEVIKRATFKLQMVGGEKCRKIWWKYGISDCFVYSFEEDYIPLIAPHISDVFAPIDSLVILSIPVCTVWCINSPSVMTGN